MNTIDLIVFGAYCAIIILVALFVSRKKKGEEKTTRDYFLAGNSLPWWAIGTSLIAANISAEQLIGMTGSGFTLGLAIASYEWMAAATLIIVGKFFLPIFLEKKIYSMPEFLKLRYDDRVRTSLALFWLALYVLVNLTSILYLGGKAITGVFKIDATTAIIAIAIFSTVYTIFGGLKAIAFTDPIQVTFLILGGLITTYLALDAYSGGLGFFGGLGKLVNDPAVADHFDMIFSADNPNYKSLPGLHVIFGAMWIMNLNYWGCNQYITQRALAAKSLGEAQKGIILAGVLKLIMPLIVVIPGIVAFALTKQSHAITAQDDTYPWLLNTFLSPGVKGIAFAALVAAVVGSLSSKTNSIATIFTMDIYKPLIKPSSSDKSLIQVGRLSTLAALAIAIPLAIWLTANIEKLGGGFQFIQEFTGFFSPGIFCIFIFGLFWKKASANAALIVAAVTLPISLIFYYVPGLSEIPFIIRMGYEFIILALIMIAVSLSKNTDKDDNKAIFFGKDLFKTSAAFNIGAIMIVCVLIFLYTKFY
jgi:solute:Na+ symporter, SSS family